MTFSRDLRFHEHINEICQKVNKSLSPLYPVAQYLPRTILNQIYTIYIRRYFDYCDTIYDGHIPIQDRTRLETLQNRAARLTTGALFRTSSDRLRLELGWDKLTTRRHIHRLTLYHKLNQSNTYIPRYLTEIMPNTREEDTNRRLRNANTHTHERPQTTSYQRSFFITTNKQYNELPEAARGLTLTKFKAHIRESLGSTEPPEYYILGSKTGNILHTRLRNEMSILNSHLYKTQKTNSPACVCGHDTESVRHYILACPLYRNQRNVLFHSISQALNRDFDQYPPHTQLDILLHGTQLDSSGGRAVARNFQTFILTRALLGGGGRFQNAPLEVISRIRENEGGAQRRRVFTHLTPRSFPQLL